MYGSKLVARSLLTAYSINKAVVGGVFVAFSLSFYFQRGDAQTLLRVGASLLRVERLSLSPFNHHPRMRF